MQGGGAVQGRELALPLCARPHLPHLSSPVHVPCHPDSSNVHAGQLQHHHHLLQEIKFACLGCRTTTPRAHPLYHRPALLLPQKAAKYVSIQPLPPPPSSPLSPSSSSSSRTSSPWSSLTFLRVPDDVWIVDLDSAQVAISLFLTQLSSVRIRLSRS